MTNNGGPKIRKFIVSVLLDCGHERAWVQEYVPKRNDQCYCVRCRRYALCVSAVEDYRILCETCKYGRNFGAALMTAQHAADRHARAQPFHRVLVKQGDRVLGVREGKGLLSELPGLDLHTPPF